MKSLYKLLFAVISLFYFNAAALADTHPFTVKVNDPPIPYDGNPEWGNDFVVSNSEPLGRPSGVYRNSNSTIYVSVPDTSIQSGSAIVILTSVNNGASWNIISSLTPASVIPKTKMIRGSTDSVYCYYISGVTIYCWNVINNRITQVRGVGFRDFDVASSSTGSMYIFMDSLGTNNLVRYGSSDGGVTWGQRGLVSSGAAHPKISFSAFGDTLSLNYYGPVLADTATSIIRNARYRESAPGTMATVGSFIDIARSTAVKEEFSSVRYGNSVWFFYSAEESGTVEIRCKVSTNAGVTYADSVVLPGPLNGDEYWFDAKYHNRGTGGADIIYYSIYDLPQSSSGIVTQMNYSTSLIPSLTAFSSPVQFADHIPVESDAGYIPTLIEYYNGDNDAGVIYVGISDAISNKLYYDRLNATSSLNLTVNLEACSPTQDTVTVLIRSALSPYNLVDSARGNLSSSGTVSLTYQNLNGLENFYIVVKHRNSIETWSKSGGEIFVNGTLSYDFTTAAAQAFGNNQVLVGSKYSIYTGDVEQNGTVDLTDLIAVFNDATNFITGYVVTDLNCDEQVNLTDVIFAYNNSSNFVEVKRP